MLFTVEVDTGFSWELSELLAGFGCRHQRTSVPSGHRSSARNTFGSGHTHVRWNELCELDRWHNLTVKLSFSVNSRYCFSDDSLTSVSKRGTKTLAKRLAAIILRSVALPMTTRFFVTRAVFVAGLAGLPLSGFVTPFLRLSGTVCHSGWRAIPPAEGVVTAVAKLTPLWVAAQSAGSVEQAPRWSLASTRVASQPSEVQISHEGGDSIA